MAEAVSVNVNQQFSWAYSNPGTLSTPVDTGQAKLSGTLTGSKMFRSQFTLAASATQTIALGSGVVDVFGQTIAFTKIYGLVIQNLGSGSGFDLTLGTGIKASDNFSMLNQGTYDGPIVQPGGDLRMFTSLPNINGFTLSGGSQIEIANQSGADPVTFNIFVVGD